MIGCLFHLLLEDAHDLIDLPLQDENRLIHHVVVLLGRDLARAGAGASPHLVLQAGPLSCLEFAVAAGPQRIHLVDLPQRVPHRGGRGVGSEEEPSRLGLRPADRHETGEGMVPIDHHVQVGLVVPEVHVVSGTVSLDQGVLEQQGLFFRLRDDVVQLLDLLHEETNLRVGFGAGTDVGSKPGSQVLRLAHVQHLPLVPFHQVHTGLYGQAGNELFNGVHGSLREALEGRYLGRLAVRCFAERLNSPPSLPPG